MNKKAYVYILECNDGSYYTGYTIDLENRLKLHNEKKASKYTRSKTPVKYVFTQEFEDKATAMSYEAKIKGLKRDQKEKLVKGQISLNQLFSD